MKYSVILGNVGSCCDRYVARGYGRSYSLDELFERVASIDGISGVELVGNWHLTMENVHYIKGKLKEFGLSAVSVIPDHFSTAAWAKGAFTSPYPEIRRLAIRETIDMAVAAREIGCSVINIWNGQDGYDYSLQANYTDGWKWLVEGISECAAAAPDVRFCLEYKPKEPRNHSFLSNLWASIVCSLDTRMPNIGITIDVGHAFEAYENVGASIAAAASKGMLFHMHVNDNYRLWDDDMIAGSVHTLEYIEMFFWLQKVGYEGYISVDEYPYREDGRNAVDQSVKWLLAFEDAARMIDQEKMESIFAENDAIASTAYLRKIIFGRSIA